MKEASDEPASFIVAHRIHKKTITVRDNLNESRYNHLAGNKTEQAVFQLISWEMFTD